MPDSILLYRYLDANAALKTIEARRFKVGRIKDFNDPFEWRPGITGIVPGAEVIANTVVNSFIEGINSQFGILCFSDTAMEPVLWSQYADSHRGVAFEVDYLIKPDQTQKVQYSDDRPVIDANWLNRPDGGRQYLEPMVKKMIYHKSPGWSYEREYRVHIALNECETADGLYFQPIPTDFLTRVVLGFRCPLEEAYLKKALDRVGLKDTKVVRAQMDQRSYAILF